MLYFVACLFVCLHSYILLNDSFTAIVIRKVKEKKKLVIDLLHSICKCKRKESENETKADEKKFKAICTAAQKKDHRPL